MKLIANETVKSGGKFVAPGGELDVDTDVGNALLASGAASRKTRAVVEDDEAGDPAIDTSLPASGTTTAPDPNVVGQAARTARRP